MGFGSGEGVVRGKGVVFGAGLRHVEWGFGLVGIVSVFSVAIELEGCEVYREGLPSWLRCWSER